MIEPTHNKHTMKKELLFLGLDVHAQNIAIAIALAEGGGGEARTYGTIPNDLHALEKVFANLQACLTAAGATFRDVVKSNLYVVGLRPEHVPVIREVRGRYFDQQKPPASTLVGVEALVGPDWLIEIEVIAVVAEA